MQKAIHPLPGLDCGIMSESWSMTKDSIYAAQTALRVGIENSTELLAKHDSDRGRDHRSNRMTAERMEREIEQMQKALAGIKEPNGRGYGPDDQ